MTRGLIAAACLLFGALLAGAADPGFEGKPPPPLRYVTFNLYHGGPFSGLTGDALDLDARLDLAAAELRALGADIIGLQEASSSRQRGNVAARLAAQLGFHHVFATANPHPFNGNRLNRFAAFLLNFSEGPAIVSRFPIVSWEVDRLPMCGKLTESRVVLSAVLQTPWGSHRVYSAHTSGTPCHTRRVAELVGGRRGPLPSVLMGDFNAPPDSPAIDPLTQEAGFLDAFRMANPTLPGLTVWQRLDSPVPTVRRRVDYLFVVPGTEVRGRVLSSRIILNTPKRLSVEKVLWPSDHYGVLAELEVFLPVAALVAGQGYEGGGLHQQNPDQNAK